MFATALSAKNISMVLTDLAVLVLSLAAPAQAGQDYKALNAPKALPAATQTIKSARETPSLATEEFRKFRQASEQGNTEAAIRHLRVAIAIDPANTDAYNHLGVLLFHSNQPLEAIEAFAAMTEIDPANFRGYLNLSFVMHSQNRFADAERMARKALEFSRSDVRARYLLGVSLAAQHKRSEEALENLRTAAPEFPDALLEISRLLIEKGDFENAMQSLQAFTQAGKLAKPEASARLMAR